jgi:hypothetical protein
VDNLTPRQREFGDRLAILLSDFADALGPRVNPDDEVLDAAAMAAADPVANAVLVEWLVLSVWQDLDSGKCVISKGCQPSMLDHHQLGLLRSWVVTLEASMQ